MQRETGKVMQFNSAKGYGFIQRPAGGNDLFVHFSAIQEEGYRQLTEGETVEYSVVEGEKGLRAENVIRPGQ